MEENENNETKTKDNPGQENQENNGQQNSQQQNNEQSTNHEFNQHFIQLVWGLQSTAWMALGKQQNPQTGKAEINLDLAKDSIDTLLMLKEKTKNNLTEAEQTMIDNSMQELEINFIEESKKQEKTEENKEEQTEKETTGINSEKKENTD